MANVSGMSPDEIREVEAEVTRRARVELKYLRCTCGDGARGHSPDCAWVQTEDDIWERIWDEVMIERSEREDT